ncbi:MAG TPA: hypothetical protein VN364_03320 [Bellilinea sp.]|nr:hypothetical protein [Bellilinea sp.]
MYEISPIGWVLIGVITLIVLSSYWSLASMLRKRPKNPNQPSWTKSWRALTNPWEAENRQMDQLSKEVKELGFASKEDEPEP